MRAHNTGQESTTQIHIRIGIHSGDIVQKDGDVFGDGVNIASRLQTLAEPDTICLSDVVYRDVVQKIPLGAVVSLSRPQLKNIVQRFQVYALLSESPKGIRQAFHVQWLKFSRRVGTAHQVVMMAVLLAGVWVLGKYFYQFPISGQPHRAAPTDSTSLPFPDKPSIVVLPFTNMSGAPSRSISATASLRTLPLTSPKFPASLSSPATRPSPTRAKQ